MNKKLYKLMDWAGIEAICYGESVHPEELLGAQTIGTSTLVQCFFPGAKSVNVIYGSEKKTEKIKAEKADDMGYFAALLPGKERKDYVYEVVWSGKDTKEIVDPYLYTNLIKESELDQFASGNALDAYTYLGAHMESHHGIKGCRFALWAPFAVAVSVVGDFNDWNALMHPMMRRDPFGVYEIFIPEAKAGDQYKFSILQKGGVRKMKSDPYGIRFEESSEHASVIVDGRPFRWTDSAFVKNRPTDLEHEPYNSYEVFLGNYLYGGDHYESLKKRIGTLVSYVKEMGYTHIELTPFLEYAEDSTMGYAPLNFYAVNGRYGAAEDYKALVNEAHKNGIGVIMQWPGNCFDQISMGLSGFDGSCLYEHEDLRRGEDARNGRKLFNYARPEVSSYLLSAVNYMFAEFHFDGMKVCDVASMLYLDYYRAPGQWTPNMYGGNENLESMDFLKRLNQMVHKEHVGCFTIAEDESTYPNMTRTSHSEDHLGFDLTCNEGFNNNLLEYMSHDPQQRKYYHDRLTLSSFYYTNEAYTIGLSQRHINYGKGGAITRMPGDEQSQVANMKAMFAYNMFHPGKKKNIMGQEFGEKMDFYVGRPMETELLKNDAHIELLEFVKELNHYYLDHPAFYGSDSEEGGFIWLHNLGAEENILSFIRKDHATGEEFIVVMNFSGADKENYRMGVPSPGRYTVVFDTECGEANGEVYSSTEKNCQGRNESISVNLPALSATVLSFSPYTKKEMEEREKAKALLEAKKQEQLRKKNELAKEKAKIRKSLKEELEKKFWDAENETAKGNAKEKEVKKTASGKTGKKA